MTYRRALGFVSEPINMLRSAHGLSVHVKMTQET